MVASKAVVISDIHVGAGELDDCDSELECHLIEFINEIKSWSDSVELIINGDFLDFVQAPPWEGKDLTSTGENNLSLCFTEEQSLQKLDAIFKAHCSIFHALGEFVANKEDNKLTILPGNHDADFFWPKVQKAFVSFICNGNNAIAERIIFHLEQVYCPQTAPNVWVEHGHQYDPCNSFFINDQAYWSKDKPPIFADNNGKERLYECIGTRLLIKFINKLDTDYPFVDNVKPFSKFVSLFCRSVIKTPFKVFVQLANLMYFLANISIHNHGELMSLDSKSKKNLDESLQYIFANLPDSEKKELTKRLKENDFPLHGHSIKTYVTDRNRLESLITFLANNPSILKNLQKENLSLMGDNAKKGTMMIAAAYRIDESTELHKKANSILTQYDEIKNVIMGHTHEVVDKEINNTKYINSGCWTRYFDFNKHSSVSSWSILKEKSYKIFPYELNYVLIDPTSILVQKVTFQRKNV